MLFEPRDHYLTPADVQSAAALYSALLDNESALTTLGRAEHQRLMDALDDFGCAWTLAKAVQEPDEFIPFEQAMAELDSKG